MSLDIHLSCKSCGNEIKSMNWLRNPFGLIYWIKDNTGIDLWHVINEHSYRNSHKVDREEFLKLAEAAYEAVSRLDKAHFKVQAKDAGYFGLSLDLADRVEDGYAFFPLCDSVCQAAGLGHASLDSYKKWTEELLDFAKALQSDSVEYYCSN